VQGPRKGLTTENIKLEVARFNGHPLSAYTNFSLFGFHGHDTGT
jgi:hypothetical protein